jgi:hypothetical protein
VVKSINEPGGYTFTGMAPGSINEPAAVPAGVYKPVITALTPPSVPVGGSNTTLYVTGTGFFDKTVIFVNGQNRATKLEADGRLSTVMRPANWGPQTVQIQVRNGVYSSNVADFTFTPAVGD